MSMHAGRAALRPAANTLFMLSSLLPRKNWRSGEYSRVYMYHVRKTAGTSVGFAFMRFSGGDPHIIERRISRYRFAQYNGYRYTGASALIRQGSYFFASSHDPAYTVHPPRAGTFRFTVLRDPIDRVVSLYRYLASPESDSSFSIRAPLSERRWAMHGFDEFLNEAPTSHVRNQLHMFSESASVDEAVDFLGKLNLVLRTEHLNNDISILERTLNLKLTLTRERSSILPFTPTSAQRDRLNELLAPEYAMLRQVYEETSIS